MTALSFMTALVRARLSGLIRIRPAEMPLSFACLGASCGRCCEVTGGGVIDAKSPSCGRTKIMQAVGGRCASLACGQCAIYDSRPRGCREYPWYNVGGRLHFDAGCPGISTGTDSRPDVQRIAPVEDYFALPGGFRTIAVWLVLRW
jgi:Fe-S-cluster containining protein